jgi:preprotein translocase subunit YajC
MAEPAFPRRGWHTKWLATACAASLGTQFQEPLMFISPAYAQGASGGSDFLVQLVPILLMFVIFYLLLLRPQQQKVKQHREMVANLRRGDTVVTGGGIVGKVTKVRDDNEIEVEIADNTRVRVVKGTVAEVRARGEPVKESA